MIISLDDRDDDVRCRILWMSRFLTTRSPGGEGYSRDKADKGTTGRKEVGSSTRVRNDLLI